MACRPSSLRNQLSGFLVKFAAGVSALSDEERLVRSAAAEEPCKPKGCRSTATVAHDVDDVIAITECVLQARKSVIHTRVSSDSAKSTNDSADRAKAGSGTAFVIEFTIRFVSIVESLYVRPLISLLLIGILPSAIKRIESHSLQPFKVL